MITIAKRLTIAGAIAISVACWKPTYAEDASAAQDHAVVEALLRLPGGLAEHAEQRAAVLRHLRRKSGTREYVNVASKLGVYEQTEELVKLLTAVPFDSLGVDAAKLLVRAKQFDAAGAAVSSAYGDEQAAAAAKALGYVNHRAVREILQAVVVDGQRSRQVRTAAAGALGRSEPGQRFLLGLAKEGRIADDIQFVVADALLGASNRQIRTEAADYVTAATASGNETIPAVRELLKMRGDGAAGKHVFNTVGTCNKCHKVRGEGKEIGPDLSEIGSKLSREDMYVALLNPSAAVSHNYETYTLLNADGQVITGLLINRTDESVTIRTAEAVDHTVATEEIEELKKQSVSLMPADLQKAMSVQNLLDLVDYLLLLRKEGEAPFRVLAGSSAETDQHDPQAAIDGFEVAEGIEVQLFAAEPQLLSPTSIDVDHLGRVWVCEAVNYRHFRNPHNEQRAEGDRILVLEDVDGDGRADRQTVFYQGTDIDSPHGVCVLGKQVIVSAGENVLVFTDEDGDLKADSKQPLFTGISGVQHDHGIHAFGVGPDGKLIFNFGNEGKQLRTADGEAVVDLAGNVVNDSRNPYQQGMVFRCNPDGSELETLGWNFRNNWEVCVDSFGTMWQSDNDDDGNRATRINYVMEFGNYGYRDELTGATWKASRIGLESEIPLQHWHLNDPGVVPNILQTGAGSPTGICFYEGTLLPEPFRNQIIHTDPGPNVVRAYPVEDDGAGYRASLLNLVKGVRDPWFRPVDVCTAPDGSLLVADWYDPGVGGHRMGDSKHGRIFRITSQGRRRYQKPKLDLASAEGVVQALQSPNLATRYLAQQAIERNPGQVSGRLQELATQSDAPRMQARALWQLARVSPSHRKWCIAQALQSDHSDLRCVGVRLSRQLGMNVLDVVDRMQNDPSPQVRRELLIALRHNQDPRAAGLWVALARQHDGADRWYLEALGIGADKQWNRFFDRWLDAVGDDWNTPAGRDIVWRCRSPKACRYLAKIIQQTATEQEQYRYFRAFDFHEGEAKRTALTEMLSAAN